ncbi:AAA family ATPase [Streptococcus salivarius]|uniref:AAA family ATPase n=1 Tax=Streptococcus salivarius TaxID=1304 RepID=UPI00189C9A7C|nr:AAA family ATPase [Streptococcus salivarius]
MDFFVVEDFSEFKGEGIYLSLTYWDDWFVYQTKYIAKYFRSPNESYPLGTVKIAEINMPRRSPNLPEHFEKLDDNFYSLGTDSMYYNEILERFPDEVIRNNIYKSLKDVAFDNLILEKVKDKIEFRKSLARDIKYSTITEIFRKLAIGDSITTPYSFKYIINEDSELDTDEMEFKVNFSETGLPTNVHAIVGRNGVGKSQLLINFLNSINNSDENRLTFNDESNNTLIDPKDFFTKIISMNFSIFDNKKGELPANYDTIGMSYIPIKHNTSLEKIYKEKFGGEYRKYYNTRIDKLKFTNEKGEKIDPCNETNKWTAVFMDSLLTCFENKPTLWGEILQILETDPVFKEHDCKGLYLNYTSQENDDFMRQSYNFFSKLSSGHKIVMLSLTKIVELVDKKVLVIIDEPELYLHPPLLSSYIRCLSELMTRRNGVVILATHSPVILQEVPCSCIYKLSRKEGIYSARRVTTNTFGESISILMDEVFGLEATESGFYNYIKNVSDSSDNLEDVMGKYGSQLGTLGYDLLITRLFNK